MIIKRFLYFIFILSSIDAFNQSVVEGNILDSSDFELPGVVITEMKTENGVVSDLDGHFEIITTKDTCTLKFSYIGLIDQEIKVVCDTIIDIVMCENPDFENLCTDKSTHISFSLLSDIQNSPFGISLDNSIDNVFNKYFPFFYKIAYTTDFKNNYSIDFRLRKYGVYKLFNTKSDLSFDFKRYYYQTQGFDLIGYSVQNDFKIRSMYWMLKVGFQELDSNNNFGIESGLHKYFSRLDLSSGFLVGYWNDYFAYHIYLFQTIFRTKFNLGFYFDRLENYNMASFALRYYLNVNHWSFTSRKIPDS